MNTEDLIQTAKADLSNTNEEIIAAAKQKIVFVVVSFSFSILVLIFAIYLYDKTLSNNLKINANYSLLNNSLDIRKKDLSNYNKQLIKIKKDCQKAIDSFDKEILIRNNKESNDKDNLNEYHKKEKEKKEKCGSLEKQSTKINNTEKEITEIYTILNNLKKDLTSVYLFLFLGVLLLGVSIISFFSYISSRQKSLSVRLMINQYHIFHFAAIQCDELHKDEDRPKALINKIINKIPITAFDNKGKSELYALFGKLRIPQRKSVEARADLIKKISEYRENA